MLDELQNIFVIGLLFPTTNIARVLAVAAFTTHCQLQQSPHVAPAPHSPWSLKKSQRASAPSFDEAEFAKIDLQSDSSAFGRGDMHLSAFLDEGDVVAYQTGTWTVDGVEVGDGTPASLSFARVDNVQVVWTHNCEHGVIRGMALYINVGEDRLSVSCPIEYVEFGPEQLVARFPVFWDGKNEDEVVLLAPLPPNLLETR